MRVCVCVREREGLCGVSLTSIGTMHWHTGSVWGMIIEHLADQHPVRLCVCVYVCVCVPAVPPRRFIAAMTDDLPAFCTHTHTCIHMSLIWGRGMKSFVSLCVCVCVCVYAHVFFCACVCLRMCVCVCVCPLTCAPTTHRSPLNPSPVLMSSTMDLTPVPLLALMQKTCTHTHTHTHTNTHTRTNTSVCKCVGACTTLWSHHVQHVCAARARLCARMSA